MPNKPIVILASARKESDTRNLMTKVLAGTGYRLIDLLDFQVFPYDYSNNYPVNDQFLKIIHELLQHQVIVFATPVYWYSMSGRMKTFFDRLTDLVTVNKQLGRQLKGRSIFLLAVGSDPELPMGFEVPFKLTAEYLNMTYGCCLYFSTKFTNTENFQEMISCFTEKVKQYYH